MLTALAAGIAVRASWLLIGAFGLRRLRREALPFDPLPASVRHAQERTGAQAGMYVSHRVSSPITFGVIRPVVLFPTSVSTMPAHVQEAIACHELIHVQRRDWLHEVAEELLRALLWFHPGIWWLIGRIRLTREQVVDQAAIRLIDSRERYVEALLAVAVSGSPPIRTRITISAAPPAEEAGRPDSAGDCHVDTTFDRFVHRQRRGAGDCRGLRGEVVSARGTGQERRLTAASRFSSSEAASNCCTATFRSTRPGDQEQGRGRRRRRDDAQRSGEVSDARVLSGPEDLRRATLEAVLRWHYAPAAMSSTSTQATLRFKAPEMKPEDVEKLAEAEDVEKLAEVEKLKVHEATLTSKNLKKHGEYDLVEVKPDESEHLATYSVALKGDHELAKKSMNWKIVELRKEPKFDGTSRILEVVTERVPDAAGERGAGTGWGRHRRPGHGRHRQTDPPGGPDDGRALPGHIPSGPKAGGVLSRS